MKAFIIALAAAFALTGFATTAYADGVEKPLTVIRMQNDGKSAAQICRYLRGRGIMPGTVRECIRDTVERNHLSVAADTRPLEAVSVFVYDGEVARSLALPEPVAQAASVTEPQPAADVPETARQDYSLFWVILAALVGLFIAYRILRSGFKKSLPEDDGGETPAPAAEPVAQAAEETQNDTVNDGDNDADAQAEAAGDVQEAPTVETPPAEPTTPSTDDPPPAEPSVPAKDE